MNKREGEGGFSLYYQLGELSLLILICLNANNHINLFASIAKNSLSDFRLGWFK